MSLILSISDFSLGYIRQTMWKMRWRKAIDETKKGKKTSDNWTTLKTGRFSKTSGKQLNGHPPPQNQ